jgi:RNA polymerase sigma factor (sigma-70 family)
MEILPPERPAGQNPRNDAMGGLPASGPGSGQDEQPLGALLLAMQSGDERVRDAAWEACYKGYWRLVWTRAFYVMRTIAWLGEPKEMAADVTSDVFVGLPDAVKHYRETGKPEQWLKQIAVRTALRKKESLTGRWSSGRSSSRETDRPTESAASRARSYISYEETADQIVARLDAVEDEERMELSRRREALRNSADATKRRWDEFLELYVQGFDFREIGEQMGLTEATARNWLCKIRKHLAQPLGAVGAT